MTANPVLVLAGMHRSGTSFAASLLQAGGAGIGETLVGPGVGNVKGHFEDRDFLEWHRAVLLRAGREEDGWLEEGAIAVPGDLAEAGRAMAARKAEASTGLWGWKDPRTTLFLDFWAAALPSAVFVLMYREPWEVADSLYRRATDAAIVADPMKAFAVWTHYSRCTIAFAKQHPGRVLLASNDAVTENPGEFVAAVNRAFGLTLKAPPGDLFDAEVMVKEPAGSWREGLCAEAAPDAMAAYQELQGLAALPGRELGARRGRDQAAAMVREWAAHRVTARRLKDTEKSLQGLAEKYGRTYGELIGHRRAAAIAAVLAEADSARGGLFAKLQKKRRWGMQELREVTVADEEGIEKMPLRYVVAGPFAPGRYAVKLEAKGEGAVRFGFGHASSEEVAGASAVLTGGELTLPVQLGIPVAAAWVKLPAASRVVGFSLQAE